jgi:endogenous inhibitor of DNA gyrase (YacG/DUF329 family)
MLIGRIINKREGIEVMKKFRCKICGYILEHKDDQLPLPPCPECGAVDEWEEVNEKEPAVPSPGEASVEQMLPREVSHDAMLAFAELPVDETDVPASDSDPFGKAAETGFEHVVPADFTVGEVAASGLDADRDASTAIEISDHPFQRPEETGFEKVIPPDITEGVTGVVTEPIADAQDQEGDSQAFAQPKATGFEQFIPHDFTEGDASQAINLQNVEHEEGERSVAFDRPEVTGFDQAVPHDFTEGDIFTVASLRVVQDDESLAPEVKRMVCPGCGTVVVIVEPGRTLPPCPICNKEVEWQEK